MSSPTSSGWLDSSMIHTSLVTSPSTIKTTGTTDRWYLLSREMNQIRPTRPSNTATASSMLKSRPSANSPKTSARKASPNSNPTSAAEFVPNAQSSPTENDR